jgi:CRP-like cAMP-binding protein
MRSSDRLTTGSLVSDALTGLARPRRARVPVELIAEVPLFAGLSRRHKRRLADLMTEARYPDGRSIVQAGQPGTAFYVIVDGAVKVYGSVVPTGRPKARLRAGDFFGELSVLDGGPRTATVVADGAVLTLRLTRSAFVRMVSKEPAVGLGIMAGLASRLRKGAATE